MEHPILTAISMASFTPLGWFAPTPQDGVPGDAQFLILIGKQPIECLPHAHRPSGRGRNQSHARSRSREYLRKLLPVLGFGECNHQ